MLQLRAGTERLKAAAAKRGGNPGPAIARSWDKGAGEMNDSLTLEVL